MSNDNSMRDLSFEQWTCNEQFNGKIVIGCQAYENQLVKNIHKVEFQGIPRMSR